MLVADEIPVALILNSVKSLREKEIEGVDVFDLYKGDHVPAGKEERRNQSALPITGQNPDGR